MSDIAIALDDEAVGGKLDLSIRNSDSGETGVAREFHVKQTGPGKSIVIRGYRSAVDEDGIARIKFDGVIEAELPEPIEVDMSFGKVEMSLDVNIAADDDDLSDARTCVMPLPAPPAAA